MRYSDQIVADQCGRYKEIIMYLIFQLALLMMLA